MIKINDLLEIGIYNKKVISAKTNLSICDIELFLKDNLFKIETEFFTKWITNQKPIYIGNQMILAQLEGKIKNQYNKLKDEGYINKEIINKIKIFLINDENIIDSYDLEEIILEKFIVKDKSISIEDEAKNKTIQYIKQYIKYNPNKIKIKFSYLGIIKKFLKENYQLSIKETDKLFDYIIKDNYFLKNEYQIDIIKNKNEKIDTFLNQNQNQINQIIKDSKYSTYTFTTLLLDFFKKQELKNTDLNCLNKIKEILFKSKIISEDVKNKINLYSISSKVFRAYFPYSKEIVELSMKKENTIRNVFIQIAEKYNLKEMSGTLHDRAIEVFYDYEGKNPKKILTKDEKNFLYAKKNIEEFKELLKIKVSSHNKRIKVFRQNGFDFGVEPIKYMKVFDKLYKETNDEIFNVLKDKYINYVENNIENIQKVLKEVDYNFIKLAEKLGFKNNNNAALGLKTNMKKLYAETNDETYNPSPQINYLNNLFDSITLIQKTEIKNILKKTSSLAAFKKAKEYGYLKSNSIFIKECKELKVKVKEHHFNKNLPDKNKKLNKKYKRINRDWGNMLFEKYSYNTNSDSTTFFNNFNNNLRRLVKKSYTIHFSGQYIDDIIKELKIEDKNLISILKDLKDKIENLSNSNFDEEKLKIFNLINDNNLEEKIKIFLDNKIQNTETIEETLEVSNTLKSFYLITDKANNTIFEQIFINFNKKINQQKEIKDFFKNGSLKNILVNIKKIIKNNSSLQIIYKGIIQIMLENYVTKNDFKEEFEKLFNFHTEKEAFEYIEQAFVELNTENILIPKINLNNNIDKLDNEEELKSLLSELLEKDINRNIVEEVVSQMSIYFNIKLNPVQTTELKQIIYVYLKNDFKFDLQTYKNELITLNKDKTFSFNSKIFELINKRTINFKENKGEESKHIPPFEIIKGKKVIFNRGNSYDFDMAYYSPYTHKLFLGAATNDKEQKNHLEAYTSYRLRGLYMLKLFKDKGFEANIVHYMNQPIENDIITQIEEDLVNAELNGKTSDFKIFRERNYLDKIKIKIEELDAKELEELEEELDLTIMLGGVTKNKNSYIYMLKIIETYIFSKRENGISWYEKCKEEKKDFLVEILKNKNNLSIIFNDFSLNKNNNMLDESLNSINSIIRLEKQLDNNEIQIKDLNEFINFFIASLINSTGQGLEAKIEATKNLIKGIIGEEAYFKFLPIFKEISIFLTKEINQKDFQKDGYNIFINKQEELVNQLINNLKNKVFFIQEKKIMKKKSFNFSKL